MYIYESCTGNLFAREKQLSYEDLYCGQCGGSDQLLGEANTKKEFLKLINKNEWVEEYIQDFVKQEFKR